MEIALTIDVDSHNSTPCDTLNIRRGVNRPDNVVIQIGDRQIEVKFEDLRRAVRAIDD